MERCKLVLEPLSVMILEGIYVFFQYRFCYCFSGNISDGKFSRPWAKLFPNGKLIDEIMRIREWFHNTHVNVGKFTIRFLEITLGCFGMFTNFVFDTEGKLCQFLFQLTYLAKQKDHLSVLLLLVFQDVKICEGCGRISCIMMWIYKV